MGRGREEWERKRTGERKGVEWEEIYTADWGPLRHNGSHLVRRFNTSHKCIT